MPFIVNQPLVTPPSPPPLGGWTAQQLIDLADRRTERRGSKVLDLNSEFVLCLQEFCLERRWPWRHLTTTLTTRANFQTYDLGDTENANAPDFHQFVEKGVHLYTQSGDPVEIEPLFDRDLQQLALDNLVTGRPAYYFTRPGLPLGMCFSLVPDFAYTVRIGYWAVPTFSPLATVPPTLPEAIPLVPQHLHHVLLKRMEAQIFRFTIGEGAAKYQATINEYNALIQKYALVDDFTPGKAVDFNDRSEHDSVQSTN